MHKLTRKTEPECLKNYSSPQQTWKSVGAACKHQIHDCLEEMQGKLCAYCEADISNPHNRHIEHFLTRARYPEQTFDWQNLFWSCENPNSCGRFKDPNLGSLAHATDIIKPDIEDPAYFFIFQANGEIVIRSDLSPQARQRACETLRIFNLNGDNTGLKTRRKAAADKYKNIMAGLMSFASSDCTQEVKAHIKKLLEKASKEEFYSTIRQILT